MGAVARRAVLGQTASFLVGSESNVRQWGPWPAGPVRPSGPCCLAVAEAPFLTLGGWKTASFLEGLGRKWGPLLAGQLHASGRGGWVVLSVQAAAVWFSCRFRKQRRPQDPAVSAGVAIAPCVSFGGWKTSQTASFLVGSESNVRQWGPWPAGPVRPSGPCCLAVAEALFLTLGGWKTASFLEGLGRKWGPLLAGPLHASGRGGWVVLSVHAAAVWFSCRFRKQRRFSGVWRLEDSYGSYGGRGPQARSVPQGPVLFGCGGGAVFDPWRVEDS